VDDDSWPDPPPEAYSRVTDAERYRPLHASADRLLADLEVRYRVERTDEVDLEPTVVRRWRRAERAVRLTPGGNGSPLTVIFTDFPGVVILAGHALEVRLPFCGCDACAEDLDELVKILVVRAGAVVAGGLTEERLRNRFGGDAFAWDLWSDGEINGSRGRIEPNSPGEAIPIGRTLGRHGSGARPDVRARRRCASSPSVASWAPWPSTSPRSTSTTSPRARARRATRSSRPSARA